MTDGSERRRLSWTGLLAGLVAGVLTIVVPPFVDRLGSPLYIGALFGIFIGDIFGAVLSVYFWVILRRRSLAWSIGFVFVSTVAYILAFFTTASSALAIGFSQNMTDAGGSLAGSPVSAFALGGTVGGFFVILAALLFFSDESRLSRNFLQALKWSPAGGILGALGWATGPLLGGLILTSVGQMEIFSSLGNTENSNYYSIFLVWQTGMGLAIGWLFSREQMRVSPISALPLRTSPSRMTHIARISLFAIAALVVTVFARREFLDHYRSALSQRAYNEHVAETPSMGNLPEVRSLPPEQVLILKQFGEYVPGRNYSAKTHPAKAPVAQSYLVRYGLPGAPAGGANVGPHIDVQVQEYPNAAWAEWEMFEQGFGIDLANPAKLLKFGSRIYGQEKAAAKGQNGFYRWASENRLVRIEFFSAEPDEVLKAYLERFPTSLSTGRLLRNWQSYLLFSTTCRTRFLYLRCAGRAVAAARSFPYGAATAALLLLRNPRKTVAVSSAPPEELASSFLEWWRAAATFALRRNTRKTAAVSSAPPEERASSFVEWWRAAAAFALLR